MSRITAFALASALLAVGCSDGTSDDDERITRIDGPATVEDDANNDDGEE